MCFIPIKETLKYGSMDVTKLLLTVISTITIAINTNIEDLSIQADSVYGSTVAFLNELVINNESAEYVPVPHPQEIKLTKPDYPDLSIITFKASEFVSYFDEMELSRTNQIDLFPSITGNSQADSVIVQQAISRGYKLRPVANTSNLRSYNGHLLQPPVIDAWIKLKAAATKEGYDLEIVSGYRSINQQRSLFVQRLETASRQVLGYTISNSTIASGNANTFVETVLKTSSIPGTSKHHTGYAIDITDNNSGEDFVNFATTEAFRWLSDNNYFHAKRFGFRPSYPDNVDKIGPNPEAWEYVWVGHPGEMGS